MIAYLIDSAKSDARETARKAAWSTGGSFFVLVGLGFLASAGWMVLEEVRDAIFASLVLGGVFAGVGFIAIGVAHMRHRRYVREKRAAAAARGVPTSKDIWVPLAEAFLLGLGAAQKTSKR